MGTDHPRHRRHRQLTAPAALALLGACAAEAPPPAAPPGHLVVRMQVSGFVTERDRVLSHAADDRHRCILPARMRLPSATGPAPGPDQPANHVFGYSVVFGPDFPPGTDFTEYGPFPGAAMYGRQQAFQLEVFAEPGQEATTGPVRLGRRVRLTVGAGYGLFARMVEAEELRAAGSVTIDPDMRGGRFTLRGLQRQLHHNRAPENEVVTVSGSWRCPAP